MNFLLTLILISQTPQEIAQKFVNLLKEEKFSEADDYFNSQMASALPSYKLKEVWKSIINQYGEFERIVNITSQREGAYFSVYVTSKFENSGVNIKVVFDKDNKIAGLWFQPVVLLEEPEKSEEPSYIKPEKYKEIKVKFGKKGWELNGILSIPEGKGPFPCVILIHGSGPHDYDETIGPNKPFRDIALFLSSNGIAVLRYNKRTFEHKNKFTPELLSKTGIYDVIVEDVIYAYKFLEKRKEIDKKNIFLLGHSLGGYLLPEIVKYIKDVKGLIFLAANSRNILDLMIEQTEYLVKLDGKIDNKERKQIYNLKKEIEKIKKGEIGEKEIILGAGKRFWNDLMNYSPLEMVKNIEKPMLFLQGKRDYQVTLKDFELWKKALKGRKDVTFKLYPDLNHLFMKGKGKSTPSEYNVKGFVDESVLKDILSWIKDKL